MIDRCDSQPQPDVCSMFCCGISDFNNFKSVSNTSVALGAQISSFNTIDTCIYCIYNNGGYEPALQVLKFMNNDDRRCTAFLGALKIWCGYELSETAYYDCKYLSDQYCKYTVSCLWLETTQN
jgi:hypothetical protein